MAFIALADAIPLHDAAAEKRAGDALKERGAEWKDPKKQRERGLSVSRAVVSRE